jgi:hypothetical protein
MSKSGGKRRGVKKNRTKTKSKMLIYGAVDREPQPSFGDSVRIMKNPNPIYYKVVKFVLVISTTGAQTFFNYSVSTYWPGNTSAVVAGTVTMTLLNQAEWQALLLCFTYFRVMRVLLTYFSTISTTLAAPRIGVALFPNRSPTGLGNAATMTSVSQQPNAVCITPQKSWSCGYFIPRTSDVEVTAAGLNNFLRGGWLPCAMATATRNVADPGIIAICMSYGTSVAPLTTTFGSLEQDYFIEFKLGE